MKVLITGATGLIGSKIVKLCHQTAIDVHYLTTSKDKIESKSNYKGFFWDPYNGVIDKKCFEEVEVIINLVGASIAKRWTRSYKKKIIDSRVVTTNLLFQTLKTTPNIIRHLVSASAIGIYKNSFQNYYKEDATDLDGGFLGTVCKKWEAAVYQFRDINIEVGIIRIGLVLAADGGAYPKIAQPISYGVGAAFGSGKQWQSWIHIHDLASLFMHILNEELSGVYNAVAPNPVSNTKLTAVVAETKNKKIVLPNIPKFLMQVALGDMHRLLFDSQRVSSNKVVSSGFRFTFDCIQPAISALENEEQS